MSKPTFIQLFSLTLALILPTAVLADCKNDPTKYATAVMQFQQQTEVNMTEAKVIVEVDTTVQPKDLSTTLGNLALIKDAVSGNWLLKSIQTDKTSSGLVNLTAYLQSTLPLGLVNNAYTFAQDKSSAGTTYKVVSVRPYMAPDAIQASRNKLSLKLYQAAEDYAKQLSKVSNQHYVISQVSFYSNDPTASFHPIMMNTGLIAGDANAMSHHGTDVTANISQTLQMTANVTFAAENK